MSRQTTNSSQANTACYVHAIASDDEQILFRITRASQAACAEPVSKMQHIAIAHGVHHNCFKLRVQSWNLLTSYGKTFVTRLLLIRRRGVSERTTAVSKLGRTPAFDLIGRNGFFWRHSAVSLTRCSSVIKPGKTTSLRSLGHSHRQACPTMESLRCGA